MKKRKLLAAILSGVMALSVPVFGAETTQTDELSLETTTEIPMEGGSIIIETKGDEHSLDCRCYPHMEITIRETEKGLLADDSVIYLYTTQDGNRSMEIQFMTTEENGLSVTANRNDASELQFQIERENTDTLGTFHSSIDALVTGVSARETENFPTFSLFLDTDAQKENNLFGFLEETAPEGIVLHEKFLRIMTLGEASDRDRERNRDADIARQRSKMPQIVLQPDSRTITIDGEEKTLLYPIHTNADGVNMISLADLLFLSYDDYFPEMTLYYYEDTESYTLLSLRDFFSFKPKTGEISYEEEPYTLLHPLEEKNGVYYISIRDLARFLHVEDRIVWDSATRRITIC